MADDSGRQRKIQPSLRHKLLKEAAVKNREDTGTPAPADTQSDGTENVDTPADDEDKGPDDPSWAPFLEAEEVADPDAGPQPKRQRAANFFANNHFFIFIRLIQILYSRLLLCKTIAADLAEQKKQPINPVAIKLGLAEPETQNFGVENGENPARHYYDHLLALCERLFDQDIDQATFEETLRLMFSNKAYIMFTVDRVVSAIVKQAQQIVSDSKSQELLKLLVADRRHERTTTRQQVAYRMKAETVLGPEESRENMYRIEYVPRTETVAVQLIKSEDLTVDAKNAIESWNFYMSSYPLIYPTEGLPHRVEQPFLKRTLQDLPADGVAFVENSDLKFRVALGNYRIFYEKQTEDYFHRVGHEEADEADDAANEANGPSYDPIYDAAKKRLDDWVQSKLDEPEDEEDVEPADVAAAAAPAAQVTEE
jgi:paired amphipathic helix protein Sin3a